MQRLCHFTQQRQGNTHLPERSLTWGETCCQQPAGWRRRRRRAGGGHKEVEKRGHGLMKLGLFLHIHTYAFSVKLHQNKLPRVATFMCTLMSPCKGIIWLKSACNSLFHLYRLWKSPKGNDFVKTWRLTPLYNSSRQSRRVIAVSLGPVVHTSVPKQQFQLSWEEFESRIMTRI